MSSPFICSKELLNAFSLYLQEMYPSKLQKYDFRSIPPVGFGLSSQKIVFVLLMLQYRMQLCIYHTFTSLIFAAYLDAESLERGMIKATEKH